MIQNIIVGIIGIVVFLYVIKKIIAMFRPNKRKSSCGCCCDCGSPKIKNKSDTSCSQFERKGTKK